MAAWFDMAVAEIVRLTPDTVHLLDRLAEDVFDDAIRPASLARFLAEPGHVMFLAVAEGVVVGMGSGVDYVHPDKPAEFWINEVGVSPAFRKKGIGRALSEALIAEARSRGCRSAWLLAEVENRPARALYDSVGGEPPRTVVMYDWDFEG
jgi:ribosomal protein S18 acetylase RimI-like enzyme